MTRTLHSAMSSLSFFISWYSSEFQNSRALFLLGHSEMTTELLSSSIPSRGIAPGALIKYLPPYFLSNGGITCQSGKMVKVDKGDWDESQGPELNHEFNFEWIRRCRDLLADHGTLWVSGTMHVIYSVGFAMQQLEMKILNNITWQKPNPPPHLAGRYFTHSTETLLWARKNEKAKHKYNYSLMKDENGGKQMKDVWNFTAPKKSEKTEGKHPTQKPLILLDRIIRASTDEGTTILDPFLGSGTTSNKIKGF